VPVYLGAGENIGCCTDCTVRSGKMPGEAEGVYTQERLVGVRLPAE
jgi:hypothetical protein